MRQVRHHPDFPLAQRAAEHFHRLDWAEARHDWVHQREVRVAVPGHPPRRFGGSRGIHRYPHRLESYPVVTRDQLILSDEEYSFHAVWKEGWSGDFST